MSSMEELDRLLSEGYLIHHIINMSNQKVQNLKKAHKFFDMSINLDILLSPDNRRKSIILLKNLSSSKNVEIVTEDIHIIKRAEERLRYQNEPIGAILHANVSALGGRSTKERIFHLDNLVSSLDNLWGWKFKLGDKAGEFVVKINLNSWLAVDIEKVLGRIQILLDYLALRLGIGFLIRHYSVAHIPRANVPFLDHWAAEERMVEHIDKQDVSRCVEQMMACVDYLHAARGLNEAYIENTMPSRLSRLWSAIESTFSSKPQRLLTNEEARLLIKCMEQIPSLANDSDRKKKLQDVINNPNRLPLLTRNQRIANNIASILEIDPVDSYERVRRAAELRGKHSHQIKNVEMSDMEASEEFLQEALRRYLQKFTAQRSTKQSKAHHSKPVKR
jgi:hypothetical protein